MEKRPLVKHRCGWDDKMHFVEGGCEDVD